MQQSGKSKSLFYLIDKPSKQPEDELSEQYMKAIKPPSPIPPPKAQPERSSTEWERDRIELAELKHAKSVIRKKEFPPYFDTEEGMLFPSC